MTVRNHAELPKQIDHPMHSRHPLILLPKPPYKSKCQVCKNPCESSLYHCSVCEFDVHIWCAFPEDDVMVIPTHHHPVRRMRRPASFICNACDRNFLITFRINRNDESYVCTEPSCGFWIHKSCALLPETAKHPEHDHPLVVDISVPVRYRKYELTCEICYGDLKPSDWIYHCRKCKYFIHFSCIHVRTVVRISNESIIGSPHPRLEMIRDLKTVMYHSLTDRDWKTAMTNISDRLTIATKSKHYPVYLKEEELHPAEVKVGSHKHSLILNSNHHHHPDEQEEIICDGCIVPIDRGSSPYYKCGQRCGFFLHTTCAFLPKQHLVDSIWKEEYHNDLCDTRKLKLHIPENPWEVVKCKACGSFCNGYGYKCTGSNCDFYLDVKCFFLIGVITHIGHKHQGSTYPMWWSTKFFRFKCSGCGDSKSGPCFDCSEVCLLKIGYECATLPATVKHRWDKHPLVLSFPPIFREDDQDDEFFCEACEEEIHPQHWAYRCAECDQSFHPRCIPTLGESRNIKFGATVSVKHHPHLLTFVPQARLTGRCHNCYKSLYWSRAFECASCDFYLCHECITKEEPVLESLPVGSSSTTATKFIE